MIRKNGIIAMTVLSSLIFCGAATTTQGCDNNQRIGPSEGELVATTVGVVAVIALGTVLLVEVHHDHHTIKGCATLGPNGVQVVNEGDSKTYTVTGVTDQVKVGDRVKVHGNKEKTQQGSTDRVFTVQQINKDYGPCKTPPLAPPNP